MEEKTKDLTAAAAPAQPSAPTAAPTAAAPPAAPAGNPAPADAPQEEQEIPQEEARRYKAVVDSLYATLQDNPELEEVMSLMARGDIDFVQAVTAVITPEELQAAADGAEDGSALSQRLTQRKEKKQKEADLEKNLAQSWAAIDKYCEQAGYDDARKQQLAEAVISWLQVWSDGKLTPDEVGKLDKMLSYDGDVTASYEDGKKDGLAQKAKAIKADKNNAAVTAGIGRVGSGAGNTLGKAQEETGYNQDDPLERAAFNIMSNKNQRNQ